MCGLLGFTAPFEFDIDKIKLLFMYNESRGTDSCGYYVSGRKEFPTNLKKKLGKSSTILITESIETGKLLIGHTRKGTNGYCITENAHPFEYTHLVGAHNGIIQNSYTLSQSRNIKAVDYNIDSQAFFMSMNQDIEAGNTAFLIKKNQFIKSLEDYEGGAALLFTLKDERLYCFRDKDRPLYHGRVRQGNLIGTYVSSMEESLKAIGCSKIRQFPIDLVHVFKDGNLVDKFKITHNPLKPAPVKTNYSNYGAGWGLNSEFADDACGDTCDTPISPILKMNIGDMVVPNEKGRKDKESVCSKIGAATIVAINLIDEVVDIEIKFMRHEYNGPIKKGDIWVKVTVDYLTSIGKSLMKPLCNDASGERIYDHENKTWTTKPKEITAITVPAPKTEADVLIDELSAIEVQEKVLRVTDFDDNRDQYFAVLLEVRDKLTKIKNGDWYNLEADSKALVEYVEEEIFTMFSLNL